MNAKIKPYYFATPVLLGLLIFASNFLSVDIFRFGDLNFAVWFVISLFCFVCGWIINKTLGWKHGGKVVFSVIISTVLLSVMLLTYFKEYFAIDNSLVENYILYCLRNVTLGTMGFFGMAYVELLRMQKANDLCQLKLDSYDKMVLDAKREADLQIKEAQLKADKIIFEAESKARRINETSEKIRSELKGFLKSEKDLLDKYENLD